MMNELWRNVETGEFRMPAEADDAALGYEAGVAQLRREGFEFWGWEN